MTCKLSKPQTTTFEFEQTYLWEKWRLWSSTYHNLFWNICVLNFLGTLCWSVLLTARRQSTLGSSSFASWASWQWRRASESLKSLRGVQVSLSSCTRKLCRACPCRSCGRYFSSSWWRRWDSARSSLSSSVCCRRWRMSTPGGSGEPGNPSSSGN